MSDEHPHADDARRDTEEAEPSGLVDSDDTTQADAGMVGGTGAAPEQASVQPYATDRGEEDDDAAEG